MIRSPNSNVFLNDFPKQNHSPSRKCLVTLKRRIWQACTVSFKWRTKFYLDDCASQPALSVSCTAGYLASYLYSCHLRVPIQTPLNVLVTLFKLHGSRFFVISFFPRSHTEMRQIEDISFCLLFFLENQKRFSSFFFLIFLLPHFFQTTTWNTVLYILCQRRSLIESVNHELLCCQWEFWLWRVTCLYLLLPHQRY